MWSSINRRLAQRDLGGRRGSTTIEKQTQDTLLLRASRLFLDSPTLPVSTCTAPPAQGSAIDDYGACSQRVSLRVYSAHIHTAARRRPSPDTANSSTYEPPIDMPAGKERRVRPVLRRPICQSMGVYTSGTTRWQNSARQCRNVQYRPPRLRNSMWSAAPGCVP